jgi:hypothetical protein
MSSSGMCSRVTLVRTNVSEERIVSIISVKRIIELLVTANVVPGSPIIFTLIAEAMFL